MSKNHCKFCFSKTTREIILRFFFRPFFRKGRLIVTLLLLGSTLLFSGCQPASVPKLLDHVLDHVLDSLWNRFSPVSQADGDEYSDGISPLHVEGTHLMNDHGEIVQLKGLSTHGIAWFPQYINSDFFLELKTQWHADIVRLAMYTQEYAGYCSGGDPAYLKTLLKNGIAYAQEAGLYVIVDWHILSDGDPNLHKEEALEFFREFSSEYSGDPHILYEICNEPNGGTSWPQIKSYAEEVIAVIRENDPNAVVLVGTPTWSQDVDLAALDPIAEYNNVMYSLHFYADTHRESLRDKLITAVSQGLPVFVTEYGICDASGSGAINEEQADAWMALLDQYQISSCAWNISNKSETSAIFRADCEKVSGFTSEDLSASGQWVFSMLQKDH